MKLSLAQYAEVILSLKLSGDTPEIALEKFVSDAREMDRALNGRSEESQAIRATLLHPKTPKKDVEQIVAKATSPEFAKFFLVLIKASDQVKLARIADKVEALSDERAGQVRVVAECAYEIDADAEKELIKSLEKRLNKKVKLTIRQNTELVCGLRLTIGDEVIDDSVSKRIELLANQFTSRN